MSTLLGPEGSASCGWAFWSSLARVSPVWGVWVLVGLLFEICIVDASIFRQLETVVGESNSLKLSV